MPNFGESRLAQLRLHIAGLNLFAPTFYQLQFASEPGMKSKSFSPLTHKKTRSPGFFTL